MTEVVNTQAVFVFTASSVPTDPSDWTFQPSLYAMKAEEGLGQVIGSAEVRYYAGQVVVPGVFPIQSQQLPILSMNGLYVQLRIGATQASSSAFWTGYVQSQTTVPDGAGTETLPSGAFQAFNCVGLPGLLSSIYINQGYVSGYNTGTGAAEQIIVVENPIFNSLPTKNQNTLGERSASTGALGNSTKLASYFDIVARSNQWTAADILTYLLVGYAQPQIPPNYTPSGPVWALRDNLSFLSYIPDKLDFEGKTVLDCINALINPRRGCVWRASLEGGTIYIVVMSTGSVSITAGTITLPQSDTTVSLDARGNPFITGMSINEDISSQFDYIQVRGAHPLVGMSLSFKTDNSGSLIKGWTAGDEANWKAAKNQGPAYQYVWSRYLLKPAWQGNTWNQTAYGLRNTLLVDSGGYTGDRIYSSTSSDSNAPAQMLAVDDFIPLPFNQDYTSTPSAGSLDMTQPLLAPMIFLYDGSSVYTDLTDDYNIQVEQNPPAIVITGDMDALQAQLTSSAVLIITLGMREADPLVVSWQADDWISDIPRVLDRRLPYCEQWLSLQGTVMMANTSGSGFNILSSTLTVVDDTAKLNSWLAVLQSWYGQAAVTVTWTDHSQIDTAYGNGTFQPGALLTSVQRGDVDLDCNAIITARAWDLTDQGWGTSYTTERIIPDIASMEGHPLIHKVWRSTAERDSLA